MFLTITLNPAVDCTLCVNGQLEIGEIHRVSSETATPGGKGLNVAKALAANGMSVLAGGILGTRDHDLFAGFLSDHAIESDFLLVDEHTRCNIMAVDEHGREIKLNRPGFPGLSLSFNRLRDYCTELSTERKVVIMAGSLPFRLPDDTYARLVRLFKKQGMTVVLDTSGAALLKGVKAGPDIIKPNRSEFEELLGRSLKNEKELLAALREFAEGFECVVVSDGGNGAYYACGGDVLYAGVPEVKVIDTTGAGDSLLGQFCSDFLGNGACEIGEEIVARSMAAGSACVELRGTPQVKMDRIVKLAAKVKVKRL